MTDSMEFFSQESQASSAESSQKPPPIPPVPPIPNLPPPNRILKPVAPSKRPIPERLQNNGRNSFNIANAFLPQELADIIATRQRRERTCHARLMICTTVISNVESTLANFIEDIEKEEVAAFKAYLRLAIANYAAADSSTAPPKIPTHSRQAKSNATGSAKEKSVLKKVAIAIPQNIVPKVAEKSWATVTRNGQKKARVTQSTQSNKLEAIPVSKTKQSVSNKNKSPSLATADTRLFIRLPQDHEWRKLSPAGIREVIVRKLVTSPALSGKIKPVNSGFAISPCSTVTRETLLNAGKGFSFSGAKLEPATNWVSVIVPTVPSKILKEQGEIEVNSSMLTDEIERVCSLRPAHVKLYGRNKAEAPHRTWMAIFTKAPSTKFRVFDESEIVRSFKKQQPIDFCKRCNGHHPAKNCSRAPSCGNCGSTNHCEDVCMAVTKCRNCGGPHRSDSRICLARPTRSGAPTKEQMKAFGQAGEREFQAVLRAKVAEESTPAPRTIAIGDFKSVYWAWQPEASSYYGQGEPTHHAGNTLDLAWKNLKDTMAWVSKEECITSDHLPICDFVPNHKAPKVNSLKSERKLQVSKEKVPQFTRLVTEWLPPNTTLNTVEETEKFAQEICWALTNSLKAVGRRINKTSGRKAPWWTPECKFDHLEYHEAVKDEEHNLRARKFRKTVASAKKEHWKRRIEDMKSSRDAYKLMRWAAPQHSSNTPPLRHEGRIIADQLERAITLRDCLLSRFSASDDLPPCTVSGVARIPWSEELTELEADENAVSFDEKKTDVIHFPGNKREELIGIIVKGKNVLPAGHIRRLGVYLDPQLSFEHHVTTWSAKALSLAQHMRRLNSVQRVAEPKALITAVEQCIVPVATFGTEM
ncbi:putative eka-like protein [Erysiphe necator]|uniref:Putative eka-like protein n=1 Tax=Uncinula necator TaxID=52586 RepID=A0A0B1NVR9_UNCNE|nr:putative eka-like protein [Erysiphe necator]